jgi:hypothetical protein
MRAVLDALREMSASTYAAWWGAIVATMVLVWDIIKWRSRGPRIKANITQDPDGYGAEFLVFVTNTGDLPATIESVKFRCLVRRALVLRRDVDLNHSFSLSGNNGFPPLPLQPGEPWEVSISPSRKLPQFPSGRLIPVVEVLESHRKGPHRYYPKADRFNAYVRSKNT